MVSQGLAVTNWHVVEGHRRITLQFRGGRRVGARVHLKDALNDVALLMPEEEDPNRPAIPLAGEIPEMGETVFTIGFPAPDLMGQQPKLTSGVVSSLSGIEDDPRFIQMSVPTQPGNSGGPLLNRKGEVIGMVTAKLNPTYALKSNGFLPENVGYAIKVDYLIPLLRGATGSPKALELSRAKADLADLASRIGPAIILVEAE
jgi:S1-C subfamily serine protease